TNQDTNIKRKRETMIANYQPINDIELAKLRKMNEEDMLEAIEEMQDEADKLLDIDEMWDAMHFLFTGVRAFEQEGENLLSEAVIGEYVLDTEEYIGYSSKERVKDIAERLEQTDFAELSKDFQFFSLYQAEVYPNRWKKETEESVLQELQDYFDMMKQFYSDMAKENKNVLVSIY
ncbi:MAG: YfbM family protein, partial [Eubacteriales bacterium]|nr:YfbM family protein [Eubacteriales bacterium]